MKADSRRLNKDLMKINKLDRYEAQTALEPSPEQIQQAKEWAVNRMMEVYVRLPLNPAPVKESFAELARQAKSGIVRQTTIIDSGKKSAVQPTKIISGGGKNSAGQPTLFINEPVKEIFSDEEKLILESLKNA